MKSNIHIWLKLVYLACKTRLHFYTTLLSREYHYLVDNCSINVLGFQLQYILVPLHLASSWKEQHRKFENMKNIAYKISNMENAIVIQFWDLNVMYIVIILFTFTLSIFVYAHIVSMQSRVIKCLEDRIFVLSIAMLLYLLSKVFIEFPQLINFYRHATGFILQYINSLITINQVKMKVLSSSI